MRNILREKEFVYGLTQGGSRWVPTFIVLLESDRCTACGRCRKVCPGGVFELAVDSEGQKRMILSKPNSCIGCTCCNRVCPKKLMGFAPKARRMGT